MRLRRRNGARTGKRLAGKLHEPFERAGRAGRPLDLSRLYSNEAGEQSEGSPLRRRLRGRAQRSRWSEGRGPRRMRTSKARTGLRARLACHRRWSVYGKQLPSCARGGSRMRESRPYGSVWGARDETRVPTATGPGVHHTARRRGGSVAVRSPQLPQGTLSFGSITELRLDRTIQQKLT